MIPHPSPESQSFTTRQQAVSEATRRNLLGEACCVRYARARQEFPDGFPRPWYLCPHVDDKLCATNEKVWP